MSAKLNRILGVIGKDEPEIMGCNMQEMKRVPLRSEPDHRSILAIGQGRGRVLPCADRTRCHIGIFKICRR